MQDSHTIEPPIVLDNHGDILVLATIQEAESYIEPIDVENAEYRIYDCTGHVLEAYIVQLPTKYLIISGLRAVRLRQSSNQNLTTSKLELEEKLRMFLTHALGQKGQTTDWIVHASIPNMLDYLLRI